MTVAIKILRTQWCLLHWSHSLSVLHVRWNAAVVRQSGSRGFCCILGCPCFFSYKTGCLHWPKNAKYDVSSAHISLSSQPQDVSSGCSQAGLQASSTGVSQHHFHPFPGRAGKRAQGQAKFQSIPTPPSSLKHDHLFSVSYSISPHLQS